MSNPTRTRLASLMDATAANKAKWHYAQFRPCGASVTFDQAEHGTVWADCSAGTAILARLAGAPNPLHSGSFDGYGNTGTCWSSLPHIPLADVQVGDCCVYGPGPNGTHHMTMVRETGPDPLEWSNGWEGAPEYVRHSTELARQGGIVTCCRLMMPDPVPPPLPRVDAFWSWLRWYLGEGEFVGNKRVPGLRPKDAPTVIPPGWWARERKFLAARRGMA